MIGLLFCEMIWLFETGSNLQKAIAKDTLWFFGGFFYKTVPIYSWVFLVT